MDVVAANLLLDSTIGSLANSGKLRVYTGIKPATSGGALTGQTLLVEFILAADAFPPAAAGVLTANSLSSVNSIANGIASWYRLVRSNNTFILDGSVGVVPGHFDLVIDNTNIVIDQVVSLIH